MARYGDRTTETTDNHAVFERHFSTKVLAELWELSEDTIREWFRDEPGVLKLAHTGRRGKRDYATLRILESVAIRVYRDRTT